MKEEHEHCRVVRIVRYNPNDDVYLVDVYGSRQRRLVRWVYGRPPRWIEFASDRSGEIMTAAESAAFVAIAKQHQSEKDRPVDGWSVSTLERIKASALPIASVVFFVGCVIYVLIRRGLVSP